LPDLRFVKEDEERLAENDVEDRNWRGIHTITGQTNKASIDHLKRFNTLFIDVMKLLKRSELTVVHDDSEVGRFFTETYRFARAYERIFRHLWRKERRLSGKLKP